MAGNTFFCIDAHTCGNPVRVVVGGGPRLPHAPMAERRAVFLRDFDWVRRALMFEPRGHDVMSGSILYPPTRADCDIGVLFIEVSGCLPMCGHGTIGTVTVAIEDGLVTPREEGRLRSTRRPAASASSIERDGRFVEQVRLFNVAALPARQRDVRSRCRAWASWSSTSPTAATSTRIIEPQPHFAGSTA